MKKRPRSSGLPDDNIQLNGWGRISDIWGMRTRERKEEWSQHPRGGGRWEKGEIHVSGRAGNPDGVWISVRTP